MKDEKNVDEEKSAKEEAKLSEEKELSEEELDEVAGGNIFHRFIQKRKGEFF